MYSNNQRENDREFVGSVEVILNAYGLKKFPGIFFNTSIGQKSKVKLYGVFDGKRKGNEIDVENYDSKTLGIFLKPEYENAKKRLNENPTPNFGEGVMTKEEYVANQEETLVEAGE